MKEYEVVYIFDPAVPEDEVNQKLERYHNLLTEQGSAEITAVDHWGRRQLAYPIQKKASGYYVVAQFRGASEALPEFERLLKLDEGLLRYLVVLNEGEPTAPMSIATREARPASDDDGED